MLKKCKKCGEKKHIDEFYCSFKNEDSKSDICKNCTRIKNLEKFPAKWKTNKVECPICNIKFYRNVHNQRFCSIKCQKKSQQPEHLIKNGNGYYKMRFEILKRDYFTCQYCGRKAPQVELHIDHIIPRKGTPEANADNRPENLITACKACNLGKADVLLSDRMYVKNKNA